MSSSPKETSAGPELGAPSVLTGDDLRRAFEAAGRCLERKRDAINALNVFPVPDGDTGTNMLLTMRSVNERCAQSPDSSAGAVTAAMSEGALLGARGNSGVILSQFFHGLAQGLEGRQECGGDDLARAFDLASRAAYSSVSKPVDGTMLTVIRELSSAASHYVGCRGGYVDVPSVWRAALEAAKVALSRTPLQLAVLREAGVVDAGGQGVVILLEGALRYLCGEDVDQMDLEMCAPVHPDGSYDAVLPGAAGGIGVQEEYLAATEEDLYGYCTQFLIHGEGLDLGKIRHDLSAIADSTVVVGNEGLVKVHVHAYDPGGVISYAVASGTIDQVSIENMDQQHQEFLVRHRGGPRTVSTGTVDTPEGLVQHGSGGQVEGARRALAVVAVARGDGLVRLIEGLGAAIVVPGGQTMNPSTQDLLEAAEKANSEEVILLPNNPNVIPAARQAVAISNGSSSIQNDSGEGRLKLHVVPSRTIPQGVSALLSFNPEGTPDHNLSSMERALSTVKTIEVTTAVRPATVGGVAVNEGQYIGLVEGELVVAADSLIDVLQQSVGGAVSPEHEVLTLYWGGDTQESQAIETAEELRVAFPGIGVEVVYGGQPFYHYIVSLE